MSTKKPANQPKRRKPEVFLCACVGSDAPEQHAFAPLTKGFVTLVSPEDADLLAARCWSALFSGRGRPYAVSRAPGGRGKLELLHRVITGVIGDAQVDHANHNGLDNRRSNLRPATPAQNTANRRPMKRTSPQIPKGMALPKGVFFRLDRPKRPFRTQIGGKHIGCFATAKEAARAYDMAAAERWGEYAYQNYPDEPLTGQLYGSGSGAV